MHVRVRKWEDSLFFRIPEPLAEAAKLKDGTVLDLLVCEGRIVAKPVEKKEILS